MKLLEKYEVERLLGDLGQAGNLDILDVYHGLGGVRSVFLESAGALVAVMRASGTRAGSTTVTIALEFATAADRDAARTGIEAAMLPLSAKAVDQSVTGGGDEESAVIEYRLMFTGFSDTAMDMLTVVRV